MTAAQLLDRNDRRINRVVRSIESDAKRLQLQLPFPDEHSIDMARCCAILHVSDHVVRRLTVTPLRSIFQESEKDVTCIIGYNTMRSAPLRIDYDSLVHFLNLLREKHGIKDRRPQLVFNRHRDDDLLPFPWADTMTVARTAEALGVHPSKVLLRIESGQFDSYQIAPGSPWRVSIQSFSNYLKTVSRIPRNERPYGG